ncbi:MAG: thiol peroxidase [SAR324 cluster bacterium]|nr:thiol peroxidase [SAR324 cluster bacterium]
MAQITLKGNAIETAGNLPAVGSQAPDFNVTLGDLSDVSLKDYAGKTLILNIFPSVDTGTCAASVRAFNKTAGELKDTVVLCVSRDLPFAMGRFCGAEGLENVVGASELRDTSFGDNYECRITTGPLAGLMSRAVVIVDASGKVTYTEQCPEIVEEPNYDAALASLK